MIQPHLPIRICTLLLFIGILAGCRSTGNHTFPNSEDITVTPIDIEQLKDSTTDNLGFYKTKAEMYDKCMNINARIVNIPEYNTYFVYWLPDDWNTFEYKRIMILMHGKEGSAYSRINDVHKTASQNNFGLVSVQWGWRPAKGKDFTYLDSTVIYDIMGVALDYLDMHYTVDKNLSCWNGFSRGSSYSIAIAYLDKEGNNYFQLLMGIAGGLDVRVPFIADLIAGKYGETPVKGCHFYLWCGTNDKDGLTCTRTRISRDILIDRGGIIDRVVVTPDGGHMTWNNSLELQLEAVNLWISLS